MYHSMATHFQPLLNPQPNTWGTGQLVGRTSRGVTIREKRIAIYCDIFSLYCDILRYNNFITFSVNLMHSSKFIFILNLT